MKPHLLLPALLLAATATHAAGPAPVDSRITEVTVFLDRAEVTRVAEFEAAAGAASYRFDGLPAVLDRDSLRLDGAGGFTLIDLKHDSRLVREAPGEKLRALEAEQEEVERAIRAEEQRIRRLDEEAAFVAAVAKRFTTVPEEGPAPDPAPETWRNLLNFQQEELARVDTARLDAEAALKDLREELRRIREEIAKLGSGAEKRVHFADARIEMPAPGPVRLELRYVVRGALWRPAYDLRVDSEGGTVELTYFGEVQQSTGEDWENVALKLSTAKPMVGGRPPELQAWFLRYLEAMPLPRSAKSVSSRVYEDEAFLQAAEPVAMDAGALAPMELREAVVETGATAATFTVDQAADVPADGSRTRAALMRESFPAEFRHIAVPKLSPYAYLEAEITNTTDFPLLPGQAAVFLDGSFVARTGLDLVSPAETFEVSLGIDEGVSVERRIVEDLADKTGIIRNKKKLRYAYQFEIANNKQRVIELLLRDQMPKSTDDSLKIELVEPRIRPNDPAVTIDDQNFIEWRFTLKPGREVETRLEYTVEFPEDKKVLGLP